VTDASTIPPASDGSGPEKPIDLDRIERAVREILEAIGEDPDRDGLVRTPLRIAKMYEEIFAGMREDPSQHLTVTFEAEHDEMVMVRDIPLHSMCIPSKERVNAVAGAKRASQVEVGDALWTLDDDGNLVQTTVVSVGSHGDRDLVEIRAGDRKVKVTLDHPILTPSGYVAAGELVVGDKVMTVEPRRLCRDRWLVTEGYELGYVLGAVASDASIQDGRRISLVVRDQAFADRFAAALEVAFDLGAKVEAISVPSGFLQREVPMFRVRVVSSYVAGLMLHWFGGSKATREFHFPRVVLRSQEMMQGFLDGYCDGDGTELKGAGRGARMIISANDGFLDELAAVLGNRPSRSYDGSTRKLYVSPHWHRRGWYGRPGFRPEDVELLPPDGTWEEVSALERVHATGSKPFTVYSYECAPYPTFLVNGVQTHNCEHHLVPFAGRAHVAYIPGADGRITGLSKIARLVDGFAKRPQVQERLTTQIADALVEVLSPSGVLVLIEAEHFCMSMRGVKKPGSLTITNAVRGLFKSNAATRAEAMSLITYPGNRL
jgi:GTP cyclohydrolase I